MISGDEVSFLKSVPKTGMAPMALFRRFRPSLGEGCLEHLAFAGDPVIVFVAEW